MSGTWQERLVPERAELLERLTKLELFQGTDKHNMLPAADVFLLELQRVSMESYLGVLNQRIQKL